MVDGLSVAFDEAAADRVVHRLVGRGGPRQLLTGVVGSRRVGVHGEPDRVGVPVPDGQRVHPDVRGAEDESLRRAEFETTVGVDLIYASVGVCGIDRFGCVAFQAQKNGTERAVPAAGRRQRPVQVDLEAGDRAEVEAVLDLVDEHHAGAHRSDGVRAGRADADGEEVECADGHQTVFSVLQ